MRALNFRDSELSPSSALPRQARRPAKSAASASFFAPVNLYTPAREGAEEPMKKPIFFASILVTLFFVPAIPAFPQSQVPDAHVSGTLTDPSGAGIGGVHVTARLENSSGA